MSMNTGTSSTPQQRLALTRKAIVRHMAQDESGSHEDQHHDMSREEAASQGSGTWQLIQHAMRAWWRHHPARVAVDFAKPALGHYAQERPLKLLGIAAAAGAAVVLIKPWRLVSVTGLLLSTLKSSQISGVLLSLLSSQGGSGADPTDSA
jgi:hypothetical protein